MLKSQNLPEWNSRSYWLNNQQRLSTKSFQKLIITEF